MQTLEHTGHGWHPAQTARYQSDFGDTGGSALTRGPAHARVGRVIAPSAPSLPQSSWLPARSAERWSCPWSGRWRTRTREAARPHAHAPARPRFPCSHLGACTENADARARGREGARLRGCASASARSRDSSSAPRYARAASSTGAARVPMVRSRVPRAREPGLA